MCLAKLGKGMLSSVQQAFVGRDEGRSLLKTPAWEATQPVNVFKEFSSTSLKKI